MGKNFLWLLTLYFIYQPIYAQSPELRDSFNKISSILKEYEIKTPETKFNSVSKNMTCSFNYPFLTISYNYAYAVGWTDVPGEKPGKRIVKFSILDTSFSKGFDSAYGTSLYFKSESGIERTALGRKNLLSEWKFETSSIVCKQLYNEFNNFKNLIKSTGFKGSIGSTNNSASNGRSGRTIIKLEKELSGIYTVRCKVNGLPLKFIFDTGASSVSISKSEAIFMLKNGYLSQNDILASQQFQIASGDILEGTRIIIRKIDVGGLVLRNVEASVVHSDNAPLLLGQSVLRRLGKIQIDYNNSNLTIIRQ